MNRLEELHQLKEELKNIKELVGKTFEQIRNVLQNSNLKIRNSALNTRNCHCRMLTNSPRRRTVTSKRPKPALKYSATEVHRNTAFHEAGHTVASFNLAGADTANQRFTTAKNGNATMAENNAASPQRVVKNSRRMVKPQSIHQQTQFGRRFLHFTITIMKGPVAVIPL
uniref:Uncharacterized protein n=1 Tax=Globodera rostochiensis TaxID=31243 RepID=A0A914HNV1_GLORO